MKLDFSAYQPFDGGISGPLRTATREQAEAHFERVLHSRSHRREELARLLARHRVYLGERDEDVQRLNDLIMAAAVALHPARQLPAPWDSVITDLALELGELMIQRSGSRLSWSLYTAQAKATGFQRPVITGFTQAGSELFYVDPAFLVASYLSLAARRGTARPDYFVFLLRESLARA